MWPSLLRCSLVFCLCLSLCCNILDDNSCSLCILNGRLCTALWTVKTICVFLAYMMWSCVKFDWLGPIDHVLSLAVTCAVRRSCDIERCLGTWLLISCADWHLTVNWCYHGDWLLTVDWLLLEVVLGIARMQVNCPTFCVIVSHVHWLLYTMCIRALQLLYIWC